jgi:hypothetical protein
MLELKPARLKTAAGRGEEGFGLGEFGSIRVNAFAILQQLSVVGARFLFLLHLRGRSRSAIKPIEAIGVGAQGNFVFSQRFFRTLQLEQHIGKHFARGQFGFAFAHFILVVGNGAQPSNRIIGVARSVSSPGLHHLVLILESVHKVGPRAFARSFEQFVIMLQRILCGGRIVKMAGSNGAPPVRDELNLGRCAGDGLQR